MVVAVFLLTLVFVSSSTTTTALLFPPPSSDDDEEEESEAFNLPNNGLYVGIYINNVDFFQSKWSMIASFCIGTQRGGSMAGLLIFSVF